MRTDPSADTDECKHMPSRNMSHFVIKATKNMKTLSLEDIHDHITENSCEIHQSAITLKCCYLGVFLFFFFSIVSTFNHSKVKLLVL